MMTASPNRCYSGHHKATEEEGDQGILEKRSGERNVDSRIQVQLEAAAQDNRMETSGLWPMFHWERPGKSQV